MGGCRQTPRCVAQPTTLPRILDLRPHSLRLPAVYSITTMMQPPQELTWGLRSDPDGHTLDQARKRHWGSWGGDLQGNEKLG